MNIDITKAEILADLSWPGPRRRRGSGQWPRSLVERDPDGHR